MKNNKAKLIIITIIFFFVFASGTSAGLLQPSAKNELKRKTTNIATEAGFNPDEIDFGATVAIVIEAFLSLLGIIFLILIIWAGWRWMTAQGDEQKVTQAKDTIQRAIIGLIITISAYSITYFVLSRLPGGN